ncbi:MAG: hypothetical protein R3E75_02645 [Steroidobacteraceae bacterium]|nr:hypothetical protein [Nevskiaceae bacterium]MCP5359553.1 hypothetical protein [Nevskiaceae bacterium]MCP5473047.1 hypothetical protein [Nevskiaceae bacterium]
MNDTDNRSPHLLVILIAAVVQGWALYGLHWAIDNQAWPYTDRVWLFDLSRSASAGFSASHWTSSARSGTWSRRRWSSCSACSNDSR